MTLNQALGAGAKPSSPRPLNDALNAATRWTTDGEAVPSGSEGSPPPTRAHLSDSGRVALKRLAIRSDA
jgi:hypothetical protein